MMKKSILLITTALLAQSIYALQIRSAVDNETTTAKVSSVDVTRIFVQGDRISSVKGVKGAYTRENDEANGEIYIQPTSSYQRRAFTMLIDTEKGRHFTLLLTPISSPAETLMLVPKGVGRESAGRFERSNTYESTISHLIRAMRRGQVPSGYSVKMVNTKKAYRINKQVLVKLKSIYHGLNLRGEIYTVTNQTNSLIQVDERDFYKIGTRAVSLDSITIPAKSSVNLYRVVENE